MANYYCLPGAWCLNPNHNIIITSRCFSILISSGTLMKRKTSHWNWIPCSLVPISSQFNGNVCNVHASHNSPDIIKIIENRQTQRAANSQLSFSLSPNCVVYGVRRSLTDTELMLQNLQCLYSLVHISGNATMLWGVLMFSSNAATPEGGSMCTEPLDDGFCILCKLRTRILYVSTFNQPHRLLIIYLLPLYCSQII